jgi:integrase
MPKISVSKRTVDAVKPTARETTYWDDKLTGFGLKVTPAGGKIYVYRYRLALPGRAAGTAPKKHTIGKHGSLTPDQARDIAKGLAALVATGADPREIETDKLVAKDRAKLEAQEQARNSDKLAFNKVAAAWLDDYENVKVRRKNSVAQAKMTVNKHLLPAFGDTPLPHITRSDMQAIIDAIPAKHIGARRSAYAYASILFNWARHRELIDANPVSGMEKPKAPRARDRVLGDDELAAVWRASQTTPQPYACFYRLLMLTGQRREEVAGLRWAEIDRATATWIIPSERAKNGTAHLIPLSAPVIAELDILAGDQAWPKSGFVLTTTGRKPISGFSKGKRALDFKIAEARGGEPMVSWCAHDLRRTMATGFQRLGVRFEVTEATLNHVSGAKGGVAGIYQRHDWREEKRTALDAWARHVEAISKPGLHL